MLKKALGITSQYRHRIIDFVPFEQSILVEYQGVDSWGKTFGRTYETVAYWYQKPPELPVLSISRPAENLYRITWSPAGSYDLEFDTSPLFTSPVATDVTGLTQYDYPTTEDAGFFRLKLK